MTRGSLRGPRTLWGSFGGSWNCRVANERHCWCISLHFSMDVSSHKHFGTYTNRRCGCSGTWMFQHGNISTWGIFGIGNFQHEEFLAQEHFGTGIFWQLGRSVTCTFFNMGTCRHGDIWAQGFLPLGILMARIFWHSDYFDTINWSHLHIQRLDAGFTAKTLSFQKPQAE